MYKVLLVDKDNLSSADFYMAVNWKQINCKLVGTAKNGKTALNMIREHRPTLIVSDWKLSDMSGLELMESGLSENSNSAFVICGKQTDYSRVRSAFRAGAVDYWKKPATPQELESALSELTTELKKRKNQHTKTGRESISLSPAKELLFFTSVIDPGIGEAEIQRFLESESENFSATRNYVACVRFSSVSYFDNHQPGIPKKSAEYLLKEVALAFGKENIISIGSTYCKLFVIHLTDDAQPVSEVFESVAQKLEKLDPQFTVRVGISLQIDSYKGLAVGLSQSWRMAQSNIAEKGCHVVEYEFLTAKRGCGEIGRAKEYIAAHFSEELSVKDIATALFISPSYLMHLFKEEQGCTINEYITDYRIAIAKTMLKSKHYRVAEVAARTGYKNAKYFCRVFQKQVGMPPSKYI